MANYPQLDDQVGVWKLKDVNSAVMGGYWRNGGSIGVWGGGGTPTAQTTLDFNIISTTGAIHYLTKKEIKENNHVVYNYQ